MKEQMAGYFKAFSDPNRLEIIELLLKGETCGCTIIDKLPISQPTMSYHLKMISKAGLSTTKREGTWIKHFINRQKIDEMIAYLEELKTLETTSCEINKDGTSNC